MKFEALQDHFTYIKEQIISLEKLPAVKQYILFTKAIKEYEEIFFPADPVKEADELMNEEFPNWSKLPSPAAALALGAMYTARYL